MNSFRNYNEDDTHEFLSCLLESLHEDLNRIINKPDMEIFDIDSTQIHKMGNKMWESIIKRDDSIIMDHFCGLFITEVCYFIVTFLKKFEQFNFVVFNIQMICQTCNKREVNFEEYKYLSTPIPKRYNQSLSLHECLTVYTQKTIIDNWYCCNKYCNGERRYSSQVYLWKLPDVLIFVLNRSEFSCVLFIIFFYIVFQTKTKKISDISFN